MPKAKDVSSISFKVAGVKHTFEMPEHGRGIPWGEIRGLLLKEILRQFAHGRVYIEINHFCRKCGNEDLLGQVTINKNALLAVVRDEVHLHGEAAAEFTEDFIEGYTDSVIYDLRAHFYPPSIFQQIGRLVIDSRRARFSHMN